jgi:hypothetical protein
MDDLRQRFDGVEAVLGDVAVATEITGTLHRPEGDGDAWCGATADGEYVETEVALEYGASLCQRCYRSAVVHLARMSSSPVEDRHGSPEAPSEVTTDVSELSPRTSDPEALGAITVAVLVGVGGGDTYHAPAADGDPVCGEDVDTTRRRLDQTPPAARPCSRCYSAEVVAKYAGRDADEREAVEAIADGGG